MDASTKPDRYFFATDLAAEQPTDDSPGTLSGYVVKFNVLSHDRGGYRDVFRRGAFKNLDDPSKSPVDIKAYRDHDETYYLGRTSNGTLKLVTDEVGVRFSLKLPNTVEGRDTAALAARKDFGGMSFGFYPDSDGYSWKHEKAGSIREMYSGTLVEVSVVFEPGIPKTELVLHSLDANDEKAEQELAEHHAQERERRLRILEIAEKEILTKSTK